MGHNFLDTQCDIKKNILHIMCKNHFKTRTNCPLAAQMYRNTDIQQIKGRKQKQ